MKRISKITWSIKLRNERTWWLGWTENFQHSLSISLIEPEDDENKKKIVILTQIYSNKWQ